MSTHACPKFHTARSLVTLELSKDGRRPLFWLQIQLSPCFQTTKKKKLACTKKPAEMTACTEFFYRFILTSLDIAASLSLSLSVAVRSDLPLFFLFFSGHCDTFQPLLAEEKWPLWWWCSPQTRKSSHFSPLGLNLNYGLQRERERERKKEQGEEEDKRRGRQDC